MAYKKCVGVFQIRVKVEKNPELGFSISGGVGGRGNPFRPDDNVSLHLLPHLLSFYFEQMFAKVWNLIQVLIQI